LPPYIKAGAGNLPENRFKSHALILVGQCSTYRAVALHIIPGFIDTLEKRSDASKALGGCDHLVDGYQYSAEKKPFPSCCHIRLLMLLRPNQDGPSC
jgi:hypothetical protein